MTQVNKIIENYESHKINTEIFHDLMSFKVKEILLIASYYDAFILEMEGHLNEAIFGEYHQLNLSNAPRILNARDANKALSLIKNRSFDMVILTIHINDISPEELRREIKKIKPNLPVLLLVNENINIMDISNSLRRQCSINDIDRVFVWNGDSKLFIAMIKYVEDAINVKKDTEIGNVRIILLIEDSCKYYSKYLPELYTQLMKQSQALISEENLNEINKLLKMRVRPKILLANSYEQAMYFIERYSNYLLSVISDIRFPRDGLLDDNAGFILIDYIKNNFPQLPILLQSSNIKNKKQANKKKAVFIHKNSKTLAKELREFMYNHLGFGDFVFRNKKGREIKRIRTINEFLHTLKTIPAESILYHAKRNDFSSWFMARGEIHIAQNMQKLSIKDFNNTEDIRKYLIKTCKNIYFEKSKGKIINFNINHIKEEKNIVRLAQGSLGGKGRGLAFLNDFILNSSINNQFDNINISLPTTFIIGTEEFENFTQQNNIYSINFEKISYKTIRKKILNYELSKSLTKKLRILLRYIKKPLAIRSSSIFEDSIAQSFSGVYSTYIIPNSAKNIDKRLTDLSNAIKLVFASVFSPKAIEYFKAINYRIEEEKMAVIIQEVVGKKHNNLYYPDIAGVAQSYNFYPISYIKPEDGIAEFGVGLGKFVIDGMNSFKFCPQYPKIDIISQNDMIENSQKYFFALNIDNKLKLCNTSDDDCTLIKKEISSLDIDFLRYIASTWDYENNRLIPGVKNNKAPIINFHYYLKSNKYKLTDTINIFLKIFKEAMGIPIEMEFAINIKEKIDFFPLQLKPLIKLGQKIKIDLDKIKKQDIFLFSNKVLGNGVIDNIEYIIFIDNNDFNRFNTIDMANIIKNFNKELMEQNKKYILIGPGRWGSQDPLLGIPVIWSNISNAITIVELPVKDMHIEPSLGSHFFHNIISMNIGYFSIDTKQSIFNRAFIDSQIPLKKKGGIKLIKSEYPLSIIMNGIQSKGIIKINRLLDKTNIKAL